MADEYKRMCKCKDWVPNVEKINGVFALQQVRTGHGYDGERFRFCPWCGSELLAILLDIEFPKHNHPTNGALDFKRIGCEACYPP